MTAKRQVPSAEARLLARLEGWFGRRLGRIVFLSALLLPALAVLPLLPVTLWIMLRPFSEEFGGNVRAIREMFPLGCVYLCGAPFVALNALYPRLPVWKRVLAAVALAACALALVQLSGAAANRARSARLLEVAKALAPLSAALEEYRGVAGAYPERLDQLVPTHIASIPGTGMSGYPAMHYARDDRAEYDRAAEGENTGGYELSISTPSGGINFDKFYYWPSGDYPAEHPAGRLERIGGWVYLHV